MKEKPEQSWIDRIRRAVNKNIGGYETARDDDIIAAWSGIDQETRESFLENTNVDSD